MSSGSKWAGLGLNWSSFGSQSKDRAQEAEKPQQDAPDATDAHHPNDANRSSGAGDYDDSSNRRNDLHDTNGRAMGGLDDDDNVEGVDMSMDDFGTLEVFDSNAVEAPYSSQANAVSFARNNQAPPALMSAEEPPSSSKKSKKDKKKKKKGSKSKHRPDDPDVEEAPAEESAHRHAKREPVEVGDGPAAVEAEMTEVVTVPQTKRKRSSVDADGKSTKRPRSREPQTAEDGEFLQRDSASGPARVEEAVDEDVDVSDPQGSPSVAHVRRHSQSGQPTATTNVEELAREALTEHDNGQAEGGDAEMADADAEPRKRASTRKKAKPTFYDEPQQFAQEMPSPSAAELKPRKRAKPAKKKPEKPKAEVVPYGGDDEDGDFDRKQQKPRRNRMEGKTQGRFSKEEIDLLRKEWKAFAEEHGKTDDEVIAMMHSRGGAQAGEMHAELWNRLFERCPDRHRQKVINTCRKNFHNFVARGAWDEAQDDELRGLIEKHGKAWSHIAALLNRHPEDLRDRFRNYIVCGDNQKKDVWSEAEEIRLLRVYLEALNTIYAARRLTPGREYTNAPEDSIDWQEISAAMDNTRSRLQCITKWKSFHIYLGEDEHFPSLAEDAPPGSFQLELARRQLQEMGEEPRLQMIRAIQQSGASSDLKIPWSKLVDRPWRLQWHRRAQVLLWHRLKKTVPDLGKEKDNPRDIAQWLLDYHEAHHALPEFIEEEGDDEVESKLLQTHTTPYAEGGAKARGRRPRVSHEYKSADKVWDSDAEGEGPAGKEELQIDPALQDLDAELAQPTEEDGAAADLAEEPMAETQDGFDVEEVLTDERKTSSKKVKKTYGKRKGGSSSVKKSSAMLSQDPIEDDELPAEGGSKGSGKATVDDAASSDFEEGMEDVPARGPVIEEV
ncbi:myb-like DNA-binding domain-containing protein [Emericellopsis cladophorae]|uniref:Myb-like DNA-binding domain-containing protein n=1 Tax=Emericellopsis cladophorae TaxID=2686198 RepID=A0A9P9XZK5_9HYPO|nr:myb-like DNA-binding domain-containing protein [Emericellopsis cladophorae]KAI6780777.1 myb-like DNA-binding domain-containing protein [Emericellopsis cladophorae]